MSYKKHEDARGAFQELFRQSNDGIIDIKQVSYLTISPQQTRGGHWHKNIEECFILLDGECEMILETRSNEKIVKMNKENDKVLIRSGIKHTLHSKNGCRMIILSNTEFNPENPDTYTEI